MLLKTVAFCMSLGMDFKTWCLLRFFSIEDICWYFCLFNLLKIITEYQMFIGLIRQKHMLLEMGMVSSSLTWKEQIDYTNLKLNSLGYMVHSLRSLLGLKIIKQIYFSCAHSLLNYGIMFWGNSPHSRSIFITQKWIVRIMKAKAKDSYREMFSKLGILTFYSQCIFFNSYVCRKA
jgi:hypothetical protein